MVKALWRAGRLPAVGPGRQGIPCCHCDLPVATGAWRMRSDVVVDGLARSAEVKRMYVALPGRRRGLARLMLAHLEDTARLAGAEVITGVDMSCLMHLDGLARREKRAVRIQHVAEVLLGEAP